MINEVADGTQTAVLNTEHELYATTNERTHVIAVSTDAMLVGDAMVLRAYAKIASAASYELAGEEFFAGSQAVTLFFSVPLPIVHAVRFTLEQTEGTARAYPWSVMTLD